MYVTISITILFHLIHILVSDGEALCKSPQYLERGKRGLVECQFPESFFGILWYNTSDYLNNDPIAYVKGETERGGLGYESNEYYISSNGSLIINEVSLQDDRNFTAVILESPRDEYSPNNIHVIVTVRPYQMQPHIEGCNVDEQLCIKMLNGSSQISCSVTDSRPAVDLNWYRNDFSMDHLLSSTKNVTFENHLYTTIVKTMYSPNMNENVVYVCKSVSAPLLMKNEYSVVLIRNILNKFEESKPTIVYAKHVSSIELPCTEEPVLYLFWKKTGHDNRSEDLIHFVSINKSSFTKFQSHYYHLTNQRSLRIAEIDVQDEGLYTCSFSDGILEKVKVFNLQVYVMPDPEYPIVEGCHDGGYCSLTVPRTGELKCLLKGIRPKVKLRWETVNDDQKFSINFSIISHKVVANELKFDILLTSHFRIQKSFTGWLPIRCIAVDRGGIPFDISREVYVSQLKGPSQEDESKEAVNTKEGGKNGENFNRWLPFVGTALVIGVATAVCVIFYVVERRRGVERRRPHRHSNTEEVEIESVWLGGMYSSVELSNESLKLILGLVFPKLVTLTQLTIREPGREFTRKELVDVLKYADLCPALKSLSFRACMMPFFLRSEELELCGYRNVEDRRVPLLEWKYSHGSEWHRLNIQTGKWEFENREMSQEFYETLKKSFNTSLNASPIQDDSIPQDITGATLDTPM